MIGIKLLNCKKDIYNELVPLDVRTIVKKIAFKFYQAHQDLKLRKKIIEFKTLVLVLRGRNVEPNLEKIYDKEKLRLITSNEELDLIEATPNVVFLSNAAHTEPLFDFILTSKAIKLYNDFSKSHEHLMDSPVYSYLLNHNVEPIDPLIQHALSDKDPSLDVK